MPPAGIIAAVTGTNGKSSVAAFARQIWSALGASAVSLGSEGVVSARSREPLPTLEPGPMPFARFLESSFDPSTDCLIFEAHSISLDTLDYDGVPLQVAAFTNLSPDHLDYHGSMREYGAAKRRLLDEVLLDNGVAVINTLDPWCAGLVPAARGRCRRVLTIGERGDVRIVRPRRGHTGAAIVDVLGSRAELPTRDWPEFGVVNALCAIAVVVAAGASAARVLDTLGELRPPGGRMELVGERRGIRVFVDHAHNPDGLRAALSAARRETSGRVWLVFGCGGDRDRRKRPVMGAVAAVQADVVVVTDDNPRGEDAASIRREVLAGCSSAREVAGRVEAIAYAIDRLEPGDVLLITGRGGETRQQVGDRLIELDDRAVARRLLGVSSRAGPVAPEAPRSVAAAP